MQLTQNQQSVVCVYTKPVFALAALKVLFVYTKTGLHFCFSQHQKLGRGCWIKLPTACQSITRPLQPTLEFVLKKLVCQCHSLATLVRDTDKLVFFKTNSRACYNDLITLWKAVYNHCPFLIGHGRLCIEVSYKLNCHPKSRIFTSKLHNFLRGVT